MTRLRLLHVVQPTVGGVWRHVENLALGLDREAFEVAVACPPAHAAGDGEEEFAAELARQGVTLHRVPLRREPHPAGDLGACLRLARLSRHYDVIHTHSSKAGFLGRLAARLAAGSRRSGRPITLYTPNAFAFLSASRNARIYFALERLVAPCTDALIACSPSEARAAARLLPPERIHVIPNAVDVAALAGSGSGLWALGSGLTVSRRDESIRDEGEFPTQSPEPRAQSRSGATIGMIARLVPQKAPELFVQAFAQVQQARPEARALVVGDGEQREAMEALARQLRIAGAMQFLGHRSDVPALLRTMDVVVLTSRYEGLPYCLLEAMACGLPVVATRAPGTVDLVEDGVTGVLVPIDAPEAIATAILSLLDTPERARVMGEAGRRRVQEQFSLPAMLAAHESLYRRLALKLRPDTCRSASTHA